MNTTTPEEANENISKFLEDDDLPEQTPTVKPSIPWQDKPPTSWAEFFTLMSRFTKYMGWELDYDTVEDMSLAIFAHNKLETDGVELRQESFPF